MSKASDTGNGNSNGKNGGNGSVAASNGDGERRPAGGDFFAPSARKEIFGIVERNESSFWTRIGVAFENRDGSWNLRFDYLPSRADIRVQMREPRERPERESTAER